MRSRQLRGPSRTARGPGDEFRRTWLIRVSAATVMAVALLDWLGWAIGSTALTSLLPGWVPMVPWTAAALFLLAFATLEQAEQPAGGIRRGPLLAGSAALISMVVLIEYVSGSRWEFDLWLFRDEVSRLPANYPGRPAPATVIAILATATTIVLARTSIRRSELVTQIMLAVAVFPSLASVVGYLAGGTGIFVFDTTTGMAFVTAMCVLLINMAAIAVRPDRRPAALFSARPDRLSLLRLLLVFLLFPLALLLGERVLRGMGTPDQAAVVLSDIFAALVVGVTVFAVSGEQQRGLLQQATLATQLRMSERRYRLLAENGSDVILTGSTDGRIDWVSDSVTRTLGWRPQELIGRSGLDFVHPDERESIEAGLRAVAEGRPQRLEARWLQADGGALWMSGLLGPERDANGQVIGRIANWRDISAEHRVREELASERELLAVSMQALLDPLVLFKAIRGAGGRVVDFEYVDLNDAACAYVGASREQLIGSHVGSIRPAVRESGLLELYAKAMDTGERLAVDDFPIADVSGSLQYLDIRGRRVSGDRLSVTWRNVTERRQTAVALAASEEHYRLLAENTADVVFRLSEGVVSWISPSVRDALGSDAEYWIDRDVTTVIHPDDLPTYLDALQRVREGETIVRRVRIHGDDGVFHWIEAHAKQYLNPDGAVDGAICSMRIVDEAVAAEQILDRLARFDDLTGLMNRGEALRRLERASHTARSGGSHNAVLFCDVDRFKQVNDTFGHTAGDEVLRVLAQRTRECVRASDIVARMGGDEVMVVLWGLSDPDDAMTIAEKIRSSAAMPISTGEGIVHTSMSIGVTAVNANETADALIARADSAMYEAKDIGRNRVIRVD